MSHLKLFAAANGLLETFRTFQEKQKFAVTSVVSLVERVVSGPAGTGSKKVAGLGLK